MDDLQAAVTAHYTAPKGPLAGLLCHQGSGSTRPRSGLSVLAESFPSPAIAEAYLRPAVDDSLTPFTVGLPNREKLLALARDRLGWSPAEVQTYLIPVLERASRGSRAEPGTQDAQGAPLQPAITDFFVATEPASTDGNDAGSSAGTPSRLALAVEHLRARWAVSHENSKVRSPIVRVCPAWRAVLRPAGRGKKPGVKASSAQPGTVHAGPAVKAEPALTGPKPRKHRRIEVDAETETDPPQSPARVGGSERVCDDLLSEVVMQAVSEDSPATVGKARPCVPPKRGLSGAEIEASGGAPPSSHLESCDQRRRTADIDCAQMSQAPSDGQPQTAKQDPCDARRREAYTDAATSKELSKSRKRGRKAEG